VKKEKEGVLEKEKTICLPLWSQKSQCDAALSQIRQLQRVWSARVVLNSSYYSQVMAEEDRNNRVNGGGGGQSALDEEDERKLLRNAQATLNAVEPTLHSGIEKYIVESRALHLAAIVQGSLCIRRSSPFSEILFYFTRKAGAQM